VDEVLIEEIESQGTTYIMFGVCIWLLRVGATLWAFSWSYLEMTIIPLWLIIFILELTIITLVYEVSRRYKALNNTLAALHRNSKKKKKKANENLEELDASKLILEAQMAWGEDSLHNNTLLNPLRIEGIREAHACLADAYQELNTNLSVFMLFQLAFLFLTLLNSSVQFLQVCISSKSGAVGASPCIGHAALVFDSLIRMTLLTVACDAVKEEADGTAEAAARLLRRTADHDALREVKLLSATRAY
jgi:7tm Chemosensory receptor